MVCGLTERIYDPTEHTSNRLEIELNDPADENAPKN